MRLHHAVLIALLGATAACTPGFVEDNESNVLLRIVEVLTQATGATTEDASFLLSDVRFEGGVFNDNATLTVANIPKNPNPNLLQGDFNDVIIERYEVSYFRTDGHNTEGVDVPFRFSGAASGRIPANAEGEVAVILVRHQAKVEPPLRLLVGLGGEQILTMFAEVTIHGRTINERAVTASTRIPITFADFADEQ
jgi:hypothetical protein